MSINGRLDSIKAVKSGVPWGTMLWDPCFIIFTKMTWSRRKVIKFAGDAALLYKAESLNSSLSSDYNNWFKLKLPLKTPHFSSIFALQDRITCFWFLQFYLCFEVNINMIRQESLIFVENSRLASKTKDFQLLRVWIVSHTVNFCESIVYWFLFIPSKSKSYT